MEFTGLFSSCRSGRVNTGVSPQTFVKSSQSVAGFEEMFPRWGLSMIIFHVIMLESSVAPLMPQEWVPCCMVMLAKSEIYHILLPQPYHITVFAERGKSSSSFSSLLLCDWCVVSAVDPTVVQNTWSCMFSLQLVPFRVSVSLFPSFCLYMHVLPPFSLFSHPCTPPPVFSVHFYIQAIKVHGYFSASLSHSLSLRVC